MNNQQKKEGVGSKTPLFAAIALIGIAAAVVAVGAAFVVGVASAQVDISQLTPEQIQQIQQQAEVDPVLELEEEPVNATDTRQAIVRPDDSLAANGTQVLQLAGAEDIDFKGLVPEGRTVIISNTTATVTNQPVEQPGVAPGGGNTAQTPASTGVPLAAEEPPAAPEPEAPVPAEDEGGNSEEEEDEE